MPLEKCTEDGKSGWRYGSGKCWTGPGAKKKAIKQGLAIQYNGGPKFEPNKRAKSESELERMANALISRQEEIMDDVWRALADKKLAEGKQ